MHVNATQKISSSILYGTTKNKNNSKPQAIKKTMPAKDT